MQSVSSFWHRLVESQLLGSREAETLQIAFASMGHGQDAEAAAEWLVAQKKISRYQATGCLTGAYTSFIWGDFLRVEPIDSGPLRYQWRARHMPSGQQVILVELKTDTLQDRDQWAALINACEQVFAITHPLFAPCELIQRERVVMAILLDRGGTTLSRILEGGTRLTASQSAAIAAAIATDLQHFHAAGLAHGNVCPETIWIPARGVAQLLFIPPNLSMDPRRGPMNPSLANYAAPELQPAQIKATPQADLYALGCTLFEMFCGRAPFAGDDTIEEKRSRHSTEAITSLQTMGGSAQIDQIVRYLMAKNTDVRYHSSETVAAALRSLIIAEDRAKARTVPESLQQYMRCAIGRRTEQLKMLRNAYLPGMIPGSTQSRQSTDTELRGSMHPVAAPIHNLDKASTQPSSEASQAAYVISRSALDSPRSNRNRSKRWRNPVLIACAVALCLATGFTIAIWGSSSKKVVPPTSALETPPRADTDVSDTQGHSTQTVTEADEPSRTDSSNQNDSDVIWESPTRGLRPKFHYLAPRPKMIFSAHLTRIANAPWQGVLEAVNMTREELNDRLESKTGFRDTDIDRLDIGFYVRGNKIDTVWVCYLEKDQPIDSFESRWKTDSSTLYAGEPIYCRGRHCFYKPSGKANVFCVGNKQNIEQIIDWLNEETQLDNERLDVLGDSPQPLTSLSRGADGERDINLLFDTNFIRSYRDALYTDYGEPLHAAITWLLGPGEHFQAGLLSMNLGDNFFCELQMFCARGKQPLVAAEELYARLQQAPAILNQFLLSQSISEYSRAILAVAPDMVRALFRYTRYTRDRPGGQIAMLRTYLPVTAAAHLALATERLLDEVSQSEPARAPQLALPFEQRLKEPVTLAFGRDNLRNAIEYLSQESGIKIELIGKDLELEGITQNQSFGINLAKKPAEEILVEILKLANPVKNVLPTDDAQKLIYVVKRNSERKNPTIWVTTRAAAAARGDNIPSAFKSKN